MNRAQQLISAVQRSEFPHLDNLIHMFVGGSELHGAKVKNTDDFGHLWRVLGATRTSAKYEFETGTFNKRAEISVPRDKRNAAVDAALSDQSITQPRLSMLRQNSSPQPACLMPIPGADVDQR